MRRCAVPTRSVKLKLVVPRKSDGLPEARALWATHRAVNEAVAHYEGHLLLMRGEAYGTQQGTIPRDRIQAACLEVARAAQRRNGRDTPGTDADIIGLLRRLYEAIVPSVLGESGTAQAANAFLGPLTDPDSGGFLEVFGKLSRPRPQWVAGALADDPDAQGAADEWLASPAAAPWLSDTGAPPTWRQAARQGKPWAKIFAGKLSQM